MVGWGEGDDDTYSPRFFRPWRYLLVGKFDSIRWRNRQIGKHVLDE